MAVLSTDPLVFARTADGNLEIPLRKVSGFEAIAILVGAAWRLWRDEYFLNRDIGVPYLETEDGVVTERDAILGQAFDYAKLQRALRVEAMAIRGVRDLVGFRAVFDGETRNATVSGTIRSDFGDVPVTATITA